jgi:TusA-related sulfurtransferase
MIEIDTSGLSCPMPILKAHKALGQMVKGETLKLIATDDDTCTDVPVFIKSTKNELVSQETVGKKFIFLIRKN